MPTVRRPAFVTAIESSPLAPWLGLEPWEITGRSEVIVRRLNWLAGRCTLGPGTALKSSFVFPQTSLAHFNFVGDSILGRDVNFEAGSVVCNHRDALLLPGTVVPRGSVRDDELAP